VIAELPTRLLVTGHNPAACASTEDSIDDMRVNTPRYR
jgi:hypothetical protein